MEEKHEKRGIEEGGAGKESALQFPVQLGHAEVLKFDEASVWYMKVGRL